MLSKRIGCIVKTNEPLPNVTFDKSLKTEIPPTVFNGGVIGVNKLTLHKLYGKRRLSCGGNTSRWRVKYDQMSKYTAIGHLK